MIWRWKDEIRTWLYLVRVVDKVERRLEQHLVVCGLTPPQFEVLAHLHRTPNILQQELADGLRVSKGNVVGILNRLEHAGLVIRQRHPEDGRAYLLCLTEQGRTLAAKVIPEHEKIVMDCLKTLAPAERESLHTMLRKLNRALGPE